MKTLGALLIGATAGLSLSGLWSLQETNPTIGYIVTAALSTILVSIVTIAVWRAH